MKNKIIIAGVLCFFVGSAGKLASAESLFGRGGSSGSGSASADTCTGSLCAIGASGMSTDGGVVVSPSVRIRQKNADSHAEGVVWLNTNQNVDWYMEKEGLTTSRLCVGAGAGHHMCWNNATGFVEYFFGITTPTLDVSSTTIPTNGLYLPSASQLGFATASTLRTTLDVNGIAMNPGMTLNFGRGADSLTYIYRVSAGVLGVVGRISGGTVTLTSFGGTGAGVTGTDVAFDVNVGTVAPGSTGTLTFATTSTNGWNCDCTDITTSTNITKQTGGSTTTCAMTNFVWTTGIAGNWTASDHLRCKATAY